MKIDKCKRGLWMAAIAVAALAFAGCDLGGESSNAAATADITPATLPAVQNVLPMATDDGTTLFTLTVAQRHFDAYRQYRSTFDLPEADPAIAHGLLQQHAPAEVESARARSGGASFVCFHGELR